MICNNLLFCGLNVPTTALILDAFQFMMRFKRIASQPLNFPTFCIGRNYKVRSRSVKCNDEGRQARSIMLKQNTEGRLFHFINDTKFMRLF